MKIPTKENYFGVHWMKYSANTMLIPSCETTINLNDLFINGGELPPFNHLGLQLSKQ